MKMNLKKMVAVLLVMIMAFSVVSTGGADKDPYGQLIVVDNNTTNSTVLENIDGTWTLMDFDHSVRVDMNANIYSALTVTSEGTKTFVAFGNDVRAQYGRSVYINEIHAMHVEATEGGEATVRAGSVMAQSHPTDYSPTQGSHAHKPRYGIYATSDGKDSSATVEIGMHGEEKYDDGNTVRAYAYEDGKDFNGTVTSGAVKAVAENGGETTIVVKDNVRSSAKVFLEESEANAEAFGIDASASGEGSVAKVEADGARAEAINKGKGNAVNVAVNADASKGGRVEVSLKNEARVQKGTEGVSIEKTAVQANAEGKGSEADISVGYAIGDINASSSNQGETKVIVGTMNQSANDETLKTANGDDPKEGVTGNANVKADDSTSELVVNEGGVNGNATAEAKNDGEATLTVEDGGITGEASANAESGGEAVLTVKKGGINGTVTVSGKDEDSSATLTVKEGGINGDANVEANERSQSALTVGEGGISGNAYAGADKAGNAILTVEDGGITGEAYAHARSAGDAQIIVEDGGIKGPADVLAEFAADADITVKKGGITGSVTVTAEDRNSAANLIVNQGGITGDVTMTAEEKAFTILTVEDGGITGDVSMNAEGGNSHLTVEKGGIKGTVTMDSFNGGEASLSVEDGGVSGDLSMFADAGGLTEGEVTGDVGGVYAVATNEGVGSSATVTLTVNGNVTGDASVAGYEGGFAEVEITGAVTGIADLDAADGGTAALTIGVGLKDTADLYTENGSVSLNVEKGGITAEDMALNGESKEGGYLEANVVGDVKATEEDGVGIQLDVDEDSLAEIFVNGTVSADAGAVVLAEDAVIGENVTMTVWRLESTSGPLVGNEDKDGKITENTEAEQNIQYIIKIDEQSKDLFTYYGEDYEGEKVWQRKDGELQLRLTPPLGMKIDAIYVNKELSDKTVRIENGEYFLTVPEGGGVMLSVSMSPVEPEPVPPTPTPTPVPPTPTPVPPTPTPVPPTPTPEPDPEPARLVTVMIDPNGGKVNGHDKTFNLSLKEGASFTLPTPEEAPEGYELVGWYVADFGRDDPRWKDPEEDDPRIKKAGEKIIIDKAVTLTAIWKVKE